MDSESNSFGVDVNIDTIDDLKKILIKNGYSNKAITEIVNWYRTNSLA
jgi:hypothetical protein